MTPGERFTRIENFLNTVAEHRAHMAGSQERHDKEIQELREIQKGIGVILAKVAEAHRASEQKLNALIDAVDRMIRARGNDPSGATS